MKRMAELLEDLSNILGAYLNKTIIPLTLVGYEMIMPNTALGASLTIYLLISNASSWNNSIQLSPEGEVNSGGYIPRREASRYISTALHRP